MSKNANESLNYQFLLLTHVVCADGQIHSEETKALRELAQVAEINDLTLLEMDKILAQEENHLSVEAIANNIPHGLQTETMRQVLAIAYIDGYFSPLEQELISKICEYWNWSSHSEELESLLEEAEGFKPQAIKTKDQNISRPNNQKKQPIFTRIITWLINKIIQFWQWLKKIFGFKSATIKDHLPRKNQNSQQLDQELSFAARLLQNEQRSPLSRAIINLAVKVSPETIGRKVKELEREILLAGYNYTEAIEQCAIIAQEDYKFAEASLKTSYTTLHDLGKNLKSIIEEIQRKSTGKSAKQVIETLESSRRELAAKIIQDLEKVRYSLHAKQRALNQFSIAFMGKTKAGKSTLHAVITGEGWDAIGVGKQRTTRFNRVYEWKNIRIIDTPGIGAPEADGRSDEEIAKSIIDESDVICYVVTNDSIQETEFEFMKLLKDKNKPIIILLNIKYNLRDSRRLEYFLQNPDKLFQIDGKSGLKGHYDRIRRYAKQFYGNDYFPIIPVMLLSAQMSNEPQHLKIKDKLFKASKIQDFLDSIRESIIKEGSIRRSQNLLGSTVCCIDSPQRWITSNYNIYQELSNTLKGKIYKINQDINKAQSNALEQLQQEIESIFQEIFNIIPSFAEDNWQSKKVEMEINWRLKINSIKIEEKITNAYQKAGQRFNKEVKEELEEIGRELQLIAKMSATRFGFESQDTSDFWKNVFKIGGGLIGLIALIVGIFGGIEAGLIVGVITIVGIVINLVSNLFKSREQKRREAVQKIRQDLEKQIKENEHKHLQQAQTTFEKETSKVIKEIEIYFNGLIDGLETIALSLEPATKQLQSAENNLNRAYAKRIIDWLIDRYETLSYEVINRDISKVIRQFGKQINITTKSKFNLSKSQQQMQQVLQENITINHLNPKE